MLGMLALGAMITVNLIYGRFISRKQVLFYWCCFIAAYIVFFKLLDQAIITLVVQTIVVFAFLLRGAQKDASQWMK